MALKMATRMVVVKVDLLAATKVHEKAKVMVVMTEGKLLGRSWERWRADPKASPLAPRWVVLLEFYLATLTVVLMASKWAPW